MRLKDVDAVKILNRLVFDKQAGTYDSKGWGRCTLPLLEYVLAKVTVPEGGSILDVGCGTGAFLQRIVERPAIRASGLDLSPAMIRLTAERTGSKAELKVGDAENLPWPEGTFDAVACASSFHHYPQPRKALSEMRRVLKPGGRLILADVWLPVPLKQIMNSVVIPLTDEGDVRVYSRKEITDMLGADGFELLSWKRIGLLGYVAEAKTA